MAKPLETGEGGQKGGAEEEKEEEEEEDGKLIREECFGQGFFFAIFLFFKEYCHHNFAIQGD